MIRRPPKIAAFLGLAFLVACSYSSLRAGDGFEPAISVFNPLGSTSSKVTFFVTFPVKGTAGSRSGTFNPSTQSVKIRLGGGEKAVFNTSVASPGCKRTSAGTRCVFKVSANAGTDALSIDTYGKANARGPALDVVTALLPVSGAKPSFTIGPVVTNNSNHGAGSLPQAVTDAAKGDTIVFAFRKRSAITLASLINLSKRVLIAGPGPNRLTVTANGESQLFKVASLVTVTISGMTLSRGGASAAPSFGGAIYNGGNLNLDDDIFSGNSAIAPGNTAASMSNMIGRSTFDPRPRNRRSRPLQPPHAPRLPAQIPVSSAEGGAVYNAGFLSISDSVFSNNSVGQGSGGAVYSASGATIAIASSTFTGNIGAFGGAIFIAGGASFTSDTFSQNSGWPGGGAPISGAYGYGAAIYSSGTLTVDNCSFSSNVAGGNISASYGLGGAIAEYGGTLAVSNSQFASNLAGGGTNGSWGRGGAIYSASGSVSIVGDTFKLNKAGGDALGYGGAVFAVHAVTASTNTFTGNIAYGSASGAFAYGGAVYAQGDFSMNGGSFAQNSASGGSVSAFGYSYGGALDVEAGSNLTTVSFMDNVATGGAGGSAQGGAIFVNGGSNTWNAVTLSGNGSTSTGQLSYSAGGAVVAFAPLTMTGALVTGNTASASSAGLAGAGGGLAVEVGPFAFRGTISGNKATTQGGGIWLGGAATVTQSTIASNGVVGTENPNDGGGGIYDDIGGSLVLQTSTVSGNTVGGNVAASGGGGIFNAGSATISNSTISSNSSAIDGGGAENEAQSGFSLTNVTIYQNAAAHGNGGNIKNLFSDAGLSIANSIVAGGSAMIGADISNDGAITSQDYNIFQTATSGTSVTGTTTHNLQINPQLLVLSNNGGPTQTNADQATSPGTGYIPYSVCSAAGITTDQRGDPRGAKGFCDVGAFEF